MVSALVSYPISHDCARSVHIIMLSNVIPFTSPSYPFTTRLSSQLLTKQSVTVRSLHDWVVIPSLFGLAEIILTLFILTFSHKLAFRVHAAGFRIAIPSTTISLHLNKLIGTIVS